VLDGGTKVPICHLCRWEEAYDLIWELPFRAVIARPSNSPQNRCGSQQELCLCVWTAMGSLLENSQLAPGNFSSCRAEVHSPWLMVWFHRQEF